MQEKVEASIGRIKAKIAEALGGQNTLVKLGKKTATGNSANVRIEITLTTDYAVESGVYVKYEDSIRNYMRSVGIKGTWDRAIVENEQTSQSEVVYKINLATAQRRFDIIGFLGAKFDEALLNESFVASFAKQTDSLIRGIDRSFKPEAQSIYANTRVIEQGSSQKPEDSYASAQPQPLISIASIKALEGEEQRALKARSYLADFAKVDEGALYIAAEPEAAAVVSDIVAFNPKVAREALRTVRTNTDLAARDAHIDVAHELVSGGRS